MSLILWPQQSKVHSSVVHVHAKPGNGSFFEKEEQLVYRRHRRKLPNDSNDQLNSLDNDLQFQEYQGN